MKKKNEATYEIHGITYKVPTSTCIIGFSEEEREKGVKNVLENIMAETSPNLKKEISPGTRKHVHACLICATLCNPLDDSLPGSASVHGISQARILKWVAISYSSGSS